MKHQLISIAVVAGTLLAATSAWPVPPAQHAARGVIKSIDLKSQTLTLSLSNKDEPLVLFWNNSTRFSHGWNRVCPGALHPDEPVFVYYRREVGRPVLRSVSLRAKGPPNCTPASGCVSATCASERRTRL